LVFVAVYDAVSILNIFMTAVISMASSISCAHAHFASGYPFASLRGDVQIATFPAMFLADDPLGADVERPDRGLGEPFD
jgi:hypothetical protein